MIDMQLDVNDIFASIDGEVNGWGQGRPTTFIRLSGCNLRCSYCDTKQTWQPGMSMSTKEVAEEIKKIG
jgi:7-carboxy-7-deazaguanine synthase